MSNTYELFAPLITAGLSVRVVNGDQLAIEPATKLSNHMRQYIRQHKIELLVVLTTDDYILEAFEERAAIMEFDGGLPRAEAAYQAYVDLVCGQ